MEEDNIGVDKWIYFMEMGYFYLSIIFGICKVWLMVVFFLFVIEIIFLGRFKVLFFVWFIIFVRVFYLVGV